MSRPPHTDLSWRSQEDKEAQFLAAANYLKLQSGKCAPAGTTIHHTPSTPFFYTDPETGERKPLTHKFFIDDSGKIYAKASGTLSSGSFGIVTIAQDIKGERYVVKEINDTQNSATREKEYTDRHEQGSNNPLFTHRGMPSLILKHKGADLFDMLLNLNHYLDLTSKLEKLGRTKEILTKEQEKTNGIKVPYTLRIHNQGLEIPPEQTLELVNEEIYELLNQKQHTEDKLREYNLLGNHSYDALVLDMSIEAANQALDLHRLNITHLDFKLENLTIDKSRKLHIIDFGFSGDADNKLPDNYGTPYFKLPPNVAYKETLAKVKNKDKEIDNRFIDNFALLKNIFSPKRSHEPDNNKPLEQDQIPSSNTGKYKLSPCLLSARTINENPLLKSLFCDAHTNRITPTEKAKFPTALQIKTALLFAKYKVTLGYWETRKFKNFNDIDQGAEDKILAIKYNLKKPQNQNILHFLQNNGLDTLENKIYFLNCESSAKDITTLSQHLSLIMLLKNHQGITTHTLKRIIQISADLKYLKIDDLIKQKEENKLSEHALIFAVSNITQLKILLNQINKDDPNYNNYKLFIIQNLDATWGLYTHKNNETGFSFEALLETLFSTEIQPTIDILIKNNLNTHENFNTAIEKNSIITPVLELLGKYDLISQQRVNALFKNLDILGRLCDKIDTLNFSSTEEKKKYIRYIFRYPEDINTIFLLLEQLNLLDDEKIKLTILNSHIILKRLSRNRNLDLNKMHKTLQNIKSMRTDDKIDLSHSINRVYQSIIEPTTEVKIKQRISDKVSIPAETEDFIDSNELLCSSILDMTQSFNLDTEDNLVRLASNFKEIANLFEKLQVNNILNKQNIEIILKYANEISSYLESTQATDGKSLSNALIKFKSPKAQFLLNELYSRIEAQRDIERLHDNVILLDVINTPDKIQSLVDNCDVMYEIYEFFEKKNINFDNTFKLLCINFKSVEETYNTLKSLDMLSQLEPNDLSAIFSNSPHFNSKFKDLPQKSTDDTMDHETHVRKLFIKKYPAGVAISNLETNNPAKAYSIYNSAQDPVEKIILDFIIRSTSTLKLRARPKLTNKEILERPNDILARDLILTGLEKALKHQGSKKKKNKDDETKINVCNALKKELETDKLLDKAQLIKILKKAARVLSHHTTFFKLRLFGVNTDSYAAAKAAFNLARIKLGISEKEWQGVLYDSPKNSKNISNEMTFAYAKSHPPQSTRQSVDNTTSSNPATCTMPCT